LDDPRVIFTTHLGNRAHSAANAVFRLAVQNAVDVLEGRRPVNVVNPQVFQTGVWRQPDATLKVANA
jgi:phosphoglycerate dehydrogenase-like enzyme